MGDLEKLLIGGVITAAVSWGGIVLSHRLNNPRGSTATNERNRHTQLVPTWFRRLLFAILVLGLLLMAAAAYLISMDPAFWLG